MALGLALLVITGISALAGGIFGAFTGEGFLRGAAGGANWIGNTVEGFVDLVSGKFTNAGLHIMGVSDDKIQAVEAGTEDIWNTITSTRDFFLRDREYHDEAAALAEFGWDIVGGATTFLFGGIAAAKGWTGATVGQFIKTSGGKIMETVASGAMMFTAGKAVGDMQATIGDIAGAITHGSFGSLIGGNLLGVTGDPDRFGWEEPGGTMELGEFLMTELDFESIPDDMKDAFEKTFEVVIEGDDNE
jgi:hypothetical protein